MERKSVPHQMVISSSAGDPDDVSLHAADETSTRKLCPERYKAFGHESWQNTNFFALCQNDRIIGNLVVKILIWTDIDYIKA